MATHVAFSGGSAISIPQRPDGHRVARLARETNARILVNRELLSQILLRKGGFPAKGRTVVWRYLLQLPMNEEAHRLLMLQPLHQVVVDVVARAPESRFKNQRQKMSRLLSALTYWHPPIGECEWALSLAFAFVQAFGRDGVASFEAVATFLCSWGKEWLQFAPSPPVTVLARINSLASGTAPYEKAWPALRSLFGEVAEKEAALRLMDFVFAGRPDFLECLVAAFCLSGKDRIMESDVTWIVQKALTLVEGECDMRVEPLPRGNYPVLEVPERRKGSRSRDLARIQSEVAAYEYQRKLEDEDRTERTLLPLETQLWLEQQRPALEEIDQGQTAEIGRQAREELARRRAAPSTRDAELEEIAERCRRAEEELVSTKRVLVAS